MDLKNPTRTEALLANIAGHTDVPVPDMKNATRSERLLKEILDNGGGGGGDVTKEYVDTAIADAVADIDDDISALSDTVADKVDKVNGKGLSTNDYTDADKALVADSPITVTATTSPLSTANGKPRAITIYGKSEVVDGAIKSAGEGYAVVDLGTLNWTYTTETTIPTFGADISDLASSESPLLCALYTSKTNRQYIDGDMQIARWNNTSSKTILITNSNYTDATAFKTAMQGVLLCYELADPTQGNTIAIKTDNGTGINGTMATFTTGTPLRGIPDTSVRDVMAWDRSSGKVAENCGVITLNGSETWRVWTGTAFYCNPTMAPAVPVTNAQLPHLLSYLNAQTGGDLFTQNEYGVNVSNDTIRIRIENINDTSNLQTYLQSNPLTIVYELATPTTISLTATENESLSTLKTYSPQTAITINDNPEFEVEAYANTANGQVISDMQTIVSPLLTLSASGWTNNAQTVTYEHDTSKRNTIDVEPANIKAWTAAGILATSETATSITFECDTTPTADLSFRVTSMEVR